MIIGQAPIGTRSDLDSSANNLAEVLLNLQSRIHHFAEYVDLIKEIVPHVKEVSARPVNSSFAQVFISNIDPKNSHPRHLLPMGEGGTGIGQILALLYVIFTSDKPRVIFIDEPNSFLHPGATRRLFEVFSRYPQHQYIVSTHAPEVISSSNPQKIFMVRWNDDHSEIDTLDGAGVASSRRILEEVGAKLSDVFGADFIAWVEGPTEAACFPVIQKHFKQKIGISLSYVAVASTGLFDSGQKKIAIDVHNRLASGNAILPPALVFIFDREVRTEQQLADLARGLGGAVHFLPRRCYENYLLHAPALSHFINKIIAQSESIIEFEIAHVQEWISLHGASPDLFKDRKSVEVWTDDWVKQVDAPKLLGRLVQHFTENTYSYQKIIHSRQITEWILENDPIHLNEITFFLEEVILRSLTKLR